jgi:DNA topoisomerase VI subunit B
MPLSSAKQHCDNLLEEGRQGRALAYTHSHQQATKLGVGVESTVLFSHGTVKPSVATRCSTKQQKENHSVHAGAA